MSFTTKSLTAAAALAAIAGAAYLANAQDTKAPSDAKVPPAVITPGTAPAKGAAAPSTAPAGPQGGATADAAKPDSWIGMPVISADGATVGQVTQVKPSADGGKTPDLVIKSPSDGKTLTVPGNLASINGRAVQLKATSDQLSKMLN